MVKVKSSPLLTNGFQRQGSELSRHFGLCNLRAVVFSCKTCDECLVVRDAFVDRRPKETKDERNSRAILVAAKWYNAHLKDQSEGRVVPTAVVLANSDKEASLAQSFGVPCFTGCAPSGSAVEDSSQPILFLFR